MNNKVKFLRGTATEYAASTKDTDTFYYTTDDGKLYLGNKEITGGGVTIDDTLSDTSKNPVQNKVINAALNNKAELSDIPTELPANGGNADTVNNQNVEMSIYRSTLSFGVSSTDTADTIWKAIPLNSIFAIEAQVLTDPSWNFPEGTNQYSLLMIKLSNVRPLGMYLYPKSGGNVFFANVDANGAYAGNWRKLCDGGDADTLDGMHASDITLSFVNKYKPLVVSVAPTSNSVLLGWLPVDGATKYAVARYDPITQKYINISTKITNTNYTVTGLSSDTAYQFLVQAWVNNKWSTFTTSDHIITNTLPGNISAGTEDLSAGVSELATGAIYLVYE